MMMYFLVCMLLLVERCFAFVPLRTSSSIDNKYDVIVRPIVKSRQALDYFRLYAKTTSKKKNNKSKSTSTATATGGGFGRVAVKTKKVEKVSAETDDYAIFPALEAPVQETLLPTPPPYSGILSDLPEEVYDRLDQIYGFSSFNYEGKSSSSSNSDSESGNLSFDELISAPTTTTTTSTPPAGSSSTLSDLDLADLLTSATGGTVESTPQLSPSSLSGEIKSRQQSQEVTKIDAISNLPPFKDFHVLHLDPLVISVDNFFSNEECDRYIEMSTAPVKVGKDKNDGPFQTRSMTVGKDAVAKAQRTSTTWFHHFKNVPELMAKASRLFGLDGIGQWEEAQTVRYRRGERFTWHLDALSEAESAMDLGGQRIATLLVYLTDLDASEGGATIFRDLGGESPEEGPLKVQPKKGSALLFFPAAGGIPNTPFDIRTLHCGEMVNETSSNDKWISQLWLRQGSYTPSAPSGNHHDAANDAILDYCKTK